MATTKKTQQKLVDSIRATKAGTAKPAAATSAKPASSPKPAAGSGKAAAARPASKAASAASRAGERPRGEAPRPPISPYQSAGCRVWPD